MTKQVDPAASPSPRNFRPRNVNGTLEHLLRKAVKACMKLIRALL